MALEAGSGGTAPPRKPRQRKVTVKKGGDADRVPAQAPAPTPERRAPGRTGFAPQQQSGGPSVGDLLRGAGREVIEFNRDVGEDILSIPKGIAGLVGNLRNTDMEDVRNLPRDLVREAHGMGKQFVGNWSNPVKYADEHPGFFMLDLLGASAPAARAARGARAVRWADEAGELDIDRVFNEIFGRKMHGETGELTPHGENVRDFLSQSSLGGPRQAATLSDDAARRIEAAEGRRAALGREMQEFPGRQGQAGGRQFDPDPYQKTITRGGEGPDTVSREYTKTGRLDYEPGRPRGSGSAAQQAMENELRRGGPTDPYSMPYDESVSGLDELLASRPPGRRPRDVQAESRLTNAQEAAAQDDFAAWLESQAPRPNPVVMRSQGDIGKIGMDDGGYVYRIDKPEVAQSYRQRGIDPSQSPTGKAYFSDDPFATYDLSDRVTSQGAGGSDFNMYRVRRDLTEMEQPGEWVSRQAIGPDVAEMFTDQGWRVIAEILDDLPPEVARTTLERLINDLTDAGIPGGQGRFVPSYSQRDPNRESFMNRRM